MSDIDQNENENEQEQSRKRRGSKKTNVAQRLQNGSKTADKLSQKASSGSKKLADFASKNSGGQKAKMAAKASKNLSKTAGRLAKASSKLAKGAKVAAKLTKFIATVGWIILLVLIIIGLIIFILTGLGLILGGLKEIAESLYQACLDLVNGQEQNVGEQEIIDTANYLEEMGYDLYGYGFTTKPHAIKETKEKKTTNTTTTTTEPTDEDEVSYDYVENEVDEDYETKKELAYEDKDVYRYLTEYLVSDNYAYIIKNNNKNFRKAFTSAGTFFSGIFCSNQSYGTGLISLYEQNPLNGKISGVAGDAYGGHNITDLFPPKAILDAILNWDETSSSIKVNREDKVLEIESPGWGGSTLTYSLDGWTGRYSMPLEFLLSTHVATLAPDLSYRMATKFDTDVQILLYKSSGGTIDAGVQYKDDSNSRMTFSEWSSIASGSQNLWDNFKNNVAGFFTNADVPTVKDETVKDIFAKTNLHSYTGNETKYKCSGPEGSILEEAEVINEYYQVNDKFSTVVDSPSKENYKAYYEDEISQINAKIEEIAGKMESIDVTFPGATDKKAYINNTIIPEAKQKIKDALWTETQETVVTETTTDSSSGSTTETKKETKSESLAIKVNECGFLTFNKLVFAFGNKTIEITQDDINFDDEIRPKIEEEYGFVDFTQPVEPGIYEKYLTKPILEKLIQKMEKILEGDNKNPKITTTVTDLLNSESDWSSIFEGRYLNENGGTPPNVSPKTITYTTTSETTSTSQNGTTESSSTSTNMDGLYSTKLNFSRAEYKATKKQDDGTDIEVEYHINVYAVKVQDQQEVQVIDSYNLANSPENDIDRSIFKLDNGWAWHIELEECIANASDILCSDAVKSGLECTCCQGCKNLIKLIFGALGQVNDDNLGTYVPYINKVTDHWFRNVYFTKEAIKSENAEDKIVQVDNEYEKRTGERWTLYETYDGKSIGSDIEYKLYVRFPDDNGNYDATKDYEKSDGKYILCKKTDKGKGKYILSEDNGIVFKEAGDGNGDHDLVIDDGTKKYPKYSKSITEFRTEKKAISQKMNELWEGKETAYDLGDSDASWKTVEERDDMPDSLKELYKVGLEPIYSKKYQTVTQTEDGVRGATNEKIKNMFLDDYYLYDGSPERAALIAKAKSKVFRKLEEKGLKYDEDDVKNFCNDYNDPDLYKKYFEKENGKYKKIITFLSEEGDIVPKNSDGSVKKKYTNYKGDEVTVKAKGEGKDMKVTGTYTEKDEDGNVVKDKKGKPKTKTIKINRLSTDIDDITGPISLEKSSLNAFSILKSMHTLDAEYIYHDFKELIVELNYFDKEDLTEPEDEVMMFPIQSVSPAGWPVARYDKSNDFYGTLIHSAADYEALRKQENLELVKIYGLDEELAEDPPPQTETSTNINNSETDTKVGKTVTINGVTYKHYFQGDYNDPSKDLPPGWDTTISGTGCGLCSTANLLTGYGYDVTPRDMISRLKELNLTYPNDGTRTVKIQKLFESYGIKGKWETNTGSKESIKAILEKAFSEGKPVIMRIGVNSVGPWTSGGGHYFGVVGVQDGTLYTVDSAWRNVTARQVNPGGIDALLNSVGHCVKGIFVPEQVPNGFVPNTDNSVSTSSTPDFMGFNGSTEDAPEPVLAPVTGEVLKYGTVSRKNIETGETEDVGFIKIRALGTNEAKTGAKKCEYFGSKKEEKGFNDFWQEYTNAGINDHIIYMEGFDVSEIFGKKDIDGDPKKNKNVLSKYIADKDKGGQYNNYNTLYEVPNMLDKDKQKELEEAEENKKNAIYTITKEVTNEKDKKEKKVYVKEGAVIGFTYSDENPSEGMKETKIEVLDEPAEDATDPNTAGTTNPSGIPGEAAPAKKKNADKSGDKSEQDDKNKSDDETSDTGEPEINTTTKKFMIGNYIKLIFRDTDDEVVENVEDYIEIPEEGGSDASTDFDIGVDYDTRADSGTCTVSKEDFCTIFASHSKIVEHVDDFFAMQEKYNVSAVFAAAVCIQEQGGGTANSTCCNANNWFSISGTGPAGTTGRWKKYNNPSESIDDFGHQIAEGTYYYKQGKYTVSQIGPTYCEGNEWAGHISGHMTKALEKLQNGGNS